MYAAMAKEGITDEELSVAKRQIANTLDEQMREPGFWLQPPGSDDVRGDEPRRGDAGSRRRIRRSPPSRCGRRLPAIISPASVHG